MERGDILMRVRGGSWHVPRTRGYYDSEAALQCMLAEEPSLLPGVGDGARAVTEFATRVGPSDVVVVDEHGAITIVECKLASNEESRRKIVGQVFDYAARLWTSRRSEFEARWVQRGGAPFHDWLDAGALEELDQALEDGRFRLVLAVDRITDELQRLVEYVNAHTNDTVELLALELNVVREGDVEVLIPTVFGTELVDAAERMGNSSRRGMWTVDDVSAHLAQHAPDLIAPVERLVRGCEQAGARVMGGRAALPSVTVAVDAATGTMWPLNFYTGPGQTSLNVNYDWCRRAGEDALERFLVETTAVLPELDADAIRAAHYRKRPGVPGEAVARDGVVDALIHAVEHLVESARPPA